MVTVPLALSSTVFAIAFAVVFAIWYFKERTLSIHRIVTTTGSRSTGWSSGDLRTRHCRRRLDARADRLGTGAVGSAAAGLIALVFVAWRLGAGPVLCFWLAYILTRPLGANIGDYLASAKPTEALVSAPSARACCS